MSGLGLGSNNGILYGYTGEPASKYYGRKITFAAMAENVLYITFEDSIKIKLTDEGQSCCETRHLSTDDDLTFLWGKTLTGMDYKETTANEEYDTHEIVFLEIKTDQGSVTIASHNEHNGYYGGISLQIEEEV